MKPNRAVLIGALVTIAASQPAYAYLDPGTGSILLQGLIAAIAAVAVTGRIYWAKIKSFFGSEPPAQDEKDAPKDDDKS